MKSDNWMVFIAATVNCRMLLPRQMPEKCNWRCERDNWMECTEIFHSTKATDSMIAQLNGVFTAWTSLMDTALPLLWIFSSLFVVVANTHFDGMAHLRYQLTAFLSHYRLSLGTQRPIRTETETHILVIGSRSRYSDAFNGTQCDDFITARTFSGLRSDKCDVNFNSRLFASNESRP